MDDPFSALKKALESVFDSVPNGIEPDDYFEIQQIMNAVENYTCNKPKTFFDLIKAVGGALPYFEKWGVDFKPIKDASDALAQIHTKSDVKWDIFLAHTSRLRFHVGHDSELISWLSSISGQSFTNKKSKEQTNLLIEHSEHLGFSLKLGAHLKKDPEFLARLTLESENNFIKIANSRLILYLTHEQIAKAIIQYLPNVTEEHQNSLMRVEQLVDKINSVLTNGLSILTLLRSGEAKAILDGSELFQIYQSDEYKNRGEEYPTVLTEEEGPKFEI